MDTFAPKVGCPLCSIVATPSISHASTTANSPRIVYKDDNVTAYVELNNPISSKGHIVIVFNLHVPSVHFLSSTDLPMLTHIQHLASKLLTSLQSPHPLQSPNPPFLPNTAQASNGHTNSSPNPHVGFISSPFYDPKIPIKDHLHVHAYGGTPDLAGWWRKVAFSGIAWYSIEDLIAEIREQTSNNRIKSAHPGRNTAPIGMVHDAGAKAGLPNGRELPPHGLGFTTHPSGRSSLEAGLLSLQPTEDHASPNRLSALTSPPPSQKSQPLATTPNMKKLQTSRSRDSIPLSQVPSQETG